MDSVSKLLIKIVTSNWRKPLIRQSQNGNEDRVVCVNGAHNSARSSSGRKANPKSVTMASPGNRVNPMHPAICRNRTARNGDGAEGRGCGKKRRPICNGWDRGSNFALTRKRADFPLVLGLQKTSKLRTETECIR